MTESEAKKQLLQMLGLLTVGMSTHSVTCKS
jgi:hypothetical protein